MNLPIVPKAFDELPSDPKDRHEAFVEYFGHSLLQLRNALLRASRKRCESEESRASLPTVYRRPYDELAKLTSEQRKVALEGAQDVLDRFIYHFLVDLTNAGNDIRFGPMHSLRYRLDIEVYDLEPEDEELVWSETINRDGRRAFIDYWGRWLNRYGVPPNRPPEKA